jgi:hypothetical protein
MSRRPIRQGDVTLYPVDRLPAGLPKQARIRGRIVVQEGEATGHAHAVLDRGADLYGTELETRFLQVLTEGGVALIHEEHDTITIPGGVYEVRIGRVWEPEGVRNVAD